MFTPITTERLIIREFAAEDADGLFARRNHPEVSRYQNWKLPFTRAATDGLVESLLAMDGPEVDEWWMATIVDRNSDRAVGDLAVHLTWEGRSAEIGYNLDFEHWGKGFAAEAADAWVRFLFSTDTVMRVFGMLHPDNTASAQVLERSGLKFEGHTRLSFWDADGPSDDWIYGTTRDDWQAWQSRVRTPPISVSLTNVSRDNERDVAGLVTHKTQERFVAPVLRSYGDALFPEEIDGGTVVPVMRAVEADGELVGFIMLADTTHHHPEPYLWRFLIDRMHQGRGIGKRALDEVVKERSMLGDSTLMTSWVEGRGSPGAFYRSYGFEPTGNVIDGEAEARLKFG